MTFADDLAAAKQSDQRHNDVKVQVGDHQHTLRFRAMTGVDYAAATLRHPPRLDVKLDTEYGYNLTSLVEAVSPACGVRLDGGIETRMSAEEWADLFTVLDGGAVQAIQNTIFGLNEFASARAVEAAKKVLDGSALI